MSEMTEDELANDIELSQEIAYADKLQAEAAHIQWQAKREELAYRQEQLSHDWQLNGNYSFHDVVSEASADELLQCMSVWHEHDREAPWTIHLNSVGGQEFAGYAVIEDLRAHSKRCGGTHDVTIKVRGVAASMGGMILQAADHRIIGRYSTLMIHKGGMTYDAEHSLTVDQMADDVEWQRQSVERMIDLFLERTNLLTRQQIRRAISRKDWWIPAPAAVELGLADEIG